MPPVVNIRSTVTGERHAVTPEEAARIVRAEPASWTIESDAETAQRTATDRATADYSGGLDQVAAGLGAAASAASGGYTDTVLGGDPVLREKVRRGREANPGTTTIGTIGGTVAAALAAPESLLGRTPAAAVSHFGAALSAVGPEAGIATRVGRAALGAGVEGGLYNVGQGVSDLALSDDPVTMDRAAGELSSRFYAGVADPLAAPVGGVLGATEHLLLRQSRRLTELKAAAKKAEETAMPGAVIPEDIAGMDIADAKAAQKAEHARIEAEDLTPQRQALVGEVKAWRDTTNETRPWDALATGDKEAARLAKRAATKAERVALKAEKDAARLTEAARTGGGAKGARAAEAASFVDAEGNAAQTWKQFYDARIADATKAAGSRNAAMSAIGKEWGAYKATLRKVEPAATAASLPTFAKIGENVVETTMPARELAGRVRAVPGAEAADALDGPVSLAVRGDGSYEVVGNHRRLLDAMEADAPVQLRIARGAEDVADDATAAFGSQFAKPKNLAAQQAADEAVAAAKAARKAANDARVEAEIQAERLRDRAPKWVRDGQAQYMKADRHIDSLLNNMEGLTEVGHKGPAMRESLRAALQEQRQILQQMQDKADELRKMHALDKTDRRKMALLAVDDTLARNKALQQRLDALAAPHESPRLDALAAHIDMLTTPKAPPTLAAKIKAAGAYAGVSAIGHAILPGVADFAIAPVAALAAAKALGEKSGRTLQSAIRASAERTSKAVDLLLSANRTARKVAPKLVPLASKVLANTRFFGGGSPEPARGKQDLHDLFRVRSEEIAQMVEPGPNGPQVKRVVRDMIATLLSPLMQVAPHVADGLETRAVKRILFLDSKRPRATQIGMTTIPPSEMAIRAFARYVAAANDPSAVEERVAHGIATPEDRETMKALYPDRMADYVRRVVERLPELRATLPYQKRLALSQYTGAAIDASMDPRIVGQLQAGHRKEKGTEGGTKAPVPMPAFGSVKKPDPTPAQKRAG